MHIFKKKHASDKFPKERRKVKIMERHNKIYMNQGFPERFWAAVDENKMRKKMRSVRAKL